MKSFSQICPAWSRRINGKIWPPRYAKDLRYPPDVCIVGEAHTGDSGYLYTTDPKFCEYCKAIAIDFAEVSRDKQEVKRLIPSFIKHWNQVHVVKGVNVK